MVDAIVLARGASYEPSGVLRPGSPASPRNSCARLVPLGVVSVRAVSGGKPPASTRNSCGLLKKRLLRVLLLQRVLKGAVRRKNCGRPRYSSVFNLGGSAWHSSLLRPQLMPGGPCVVA